MITDNENKETKDYQVADLETPEQEPVVISSIYDSVENGYFEPGSIGGVVIDVSGIKGGTLGRLYNALKSGSAVIVDENLKSEYASAMERYYGRGKQSKGKVIYRKQG